MLPMTHPYIATATGALPLHPSYSTRAVTSLSRALIRHYGDHIELLSEHLSASPPALAVEMPQHTSRRDNDEEEIASYLTLLISFLAEDLPFWRAHGHARELLNHRLQLLRLLSVSTRAGHQRRSQAIEYALRHINLYSGFKRVLIEANRFQLGDEQPWWRAGEFLQNEIDRNGIQKRGGDLHQAGFFRVSRQQYLNRVRTPIIRMLTGTPDYMLGAAAIIALFTATQQERRELPHLTAQLQSLLFSRTHVDLKEHTTPIPIQPLYSLPREMRNLGSFFVSAPELEAMPLDARSNRLHNEASGASTKLHGQQSLLFYDHSLVQRKSERPDQFIELRLDDKSPSVLDALIHAIEGFNVDEGTLVHLPRIAAGFFNAAMRDRKHGFSTEGTFWDTHSGKRLCSIIGFDPDNKRHRKRIQDARFLFERIILHREIVEMQEDGKTYHKVAWRGPLIEQKKEELSVEIGTQEGITAHSTLQAWQIAGALWNMVKPRMEGGAPSFMALDERAFMLDASDSVPFNVYWTLINRSYITGLDRTGSVTVSVETIYKWSGLEGRYRRTSQLRTMLTNIFDRMVDRGLLSRWQSAALESTRPTSFDELMRGEVMFTYSHSHLKTLEHLLPEEHDVLIGHGQDGEKPLLLEGGEEEGSFADDHFFSDAF